jgi:AcrR family transcriptional regulator
MSTENTKSPTRRDELVRAAFDLIVETGLEGLRTRDVAARVGINIATLHYHFPTKRDLIEGVARFLADSFYGQHADWPAMEAGRSLSSLERLRQEFADARANIESRPELMIVMSELLLLARRDEAIAEMLEPLVEAWRGGIADFLAEGVRDGTFRTDLDPWSGSDLLVGAIWGASTLLATDPTAIERMRAEFERAFLRAGHPTDDVQEE